MIKVPAQHQTEPAKAAGQVRNPVTLGDYIKRKEEAMEIIDAVKPETIEDAYLRGYNDGIAEGFQRGVVWIRGR